MIPFPVYKEPEIIIIKDLSILYSIKNDFAFDFETTGLRPHGAGHRIVSCAIADSEDRAFVFMMPQTRSELKPLVDLLEDESIGKIAQNCKFETSWSRVRLRCEVRNWIWDTMLCSHVFDNRQGVTSLKIQTYLQFGVVDYESEVSPCLKAVENDNANALNRIMELVATERGQKILLHYNALDAINEYRLYKKQEIELLPF